MAATAPQQQQVLADFPEKLEPLFEPHPYIVLYGGRGGAKSWGVARALLLRGVQAPLRVLCVREFQSSIKESVHKLLADQIQILGLGSLYEVLDRTIRGPNGTEFNFEGLHRNAHKVKSYEGIDVCWAEEAVNISKTSWELLVPTIRKANSQIIITFNPELETDETYKRFVLNPPTGAVVIKIGWQNNKWFPERLKQEMADLKRTDYDAYLNVWEGQCRVLLDGAVYMEELRAARTEGRILRVPYDRTSAVSCFFDLGWADKTCIWFAQKVGFETRIIDFYQNDHKLMDFYLGVLQEKKYIYDTLWLPHDAAAGTIKTGMSIVEMCRRHGFKARIVPKISKANGINAARTIFPNCYFDEKKCGEGLRALYHYRYEIIDKESGQRSREPVHDWASHGADAFRYLAVSLKAPSKGAEQVIANLRRAEFGRVVSEDEFEDSIYAPGLLPSAQGWMAR